MDHDRERDVLVLALRALAPARGLLAVNGLMSQVLAMFVTGPIAQHAGILNLCFGSAGMLAAIFAGEYAGLRMLGKAAATALKAS